MDNVVSLHSNRELSEFFDYIYEDQVGFVYAPTKEPTTEKWEEAYFEWPKDKAKLIAHVQSCTATHEVYYAPALFSQPSAKKKYVKGTYVFWADFDSNAPSQEVFSGDIPAPSLRVRSSEVGHEHVYWKLDYFEVETDRIDNINRSLAYRLSADTSGWDANQVLRPPTTTNHKRSKSVITLAKSTTRFNPSIFDGLPVPTYAVRESINAEEVPDTLDVIAKFEWPREAFELFRKKEMVKGHRSSAMMRLGFFCAELKMSDEEAYSVLDNADRRWGKFLNRTDRDRRLLDIINRARQKYPLNPTGEVLDEFPIFGFNDFLAREVHIEWIIPGVLQRAGLVLLSGPPGTGKTQLSLQFSIHMALGKPFLGWDLGEPQRIVFVSMEMGDADLKYFVDQMAEELSEEERVTLQENLFLVPLGYGVLLDTPSEQAKINRMVEAHKPNGIIFDSLGVATVDELSSEITVKKVMDYIAHLRSDYDLFAWFIHHNRKAQATNKKPNKLSDIYGSTYITAAATTVMGLWPVKEELEITGLKVRLSKPFQTFMARRTENLNFQISTIPIGQAMLDSMEGGSDDEPNPRDSVFNIE